MKEERGSSKMVAEYPQAHFCENEIRGETSLSQVPPHPSLETRWALCLIGSRIVLMNNNMMSGGKHAIGQEDDSCMAFSLIKLRRGVKPQRRGGGGGGGEQGKRSDE